VTAGADLRLDKQVPYGAGLGGGSSDAAATLRLLPRLWDLDPAPERLRDIGGAIGADVPFFLMDAPAVYATGRGDTLSPLSSDGDAYRLPFPLLVAVPSVEVSTPWAYTQVTPSGTNHPDLRRVVRSNDLAGWRAALTNDFEPPVTAAEPSVESVRDALMDTDAAYVSLSRSGGAVYGIFETGAAAQEARTAFRSAEVRTHLMHPPR